MPFQQSYLNGLGICKVKYGFKSQPKLPVRSAKSITVVIPSLVLEKEVYRIAKITSPLDHRPATSQGVHVAKYVPLLVTKFNLINP
jgi:hypothetical protein